MIQVKHAAVLAALLFTACGPKMRVAPVMKAPENEATIARGKYLAEHVVACIDCHSDRDIEQPGFPVKPGTEYTGGMKWNGDTVKMNGEGMPGSFQPPNITQHSDRLGGWTDGEIARAIREGVNKHGDALFPMMPYPNFRTLSDEDTLAVIAFLRTIKPSDMKTDETDLDFPLNLIVNTIPEPLEGSVPQPATDAVSQGKYLTTIGGCSDCHTPQKDHLPDPEQLLSGGVVIQFGPTVLVSSANLTPDPETGLGKVTEAQFLTMIREGKGKEGKDLNGIMPWIFMKGMTDTDLKNIYAYLMSIKPIKKDAMAELAKYAKKD